MRLLKQIQISTADDSAMLRQQLLVVLEMQLEKSDLLELHDCNFEGKDALYIALECGEYEIAAELIAIKLFEQTGCCIPVGKRQVYPNLMLARDDYMRLRGHMLALLQANGITPFKKGSSGDGSAFRFYCWLKDMLQKSDSTQYLELREVFAKVESMRRCFLTLTGRALGEYKTYVQSTYKDELEQFERRFTAKELTLTSLGAPAVTSSQPSSWRDQAQQALAEIIASNQRNPMRFFSGIMTMNATAKKNLRSFIVEKWVIELAQRNHPTIMRSSVSKGIESTLLDLSLIGKLLDSLLQCDVAKPEVTNAFEAFLNLTVLSAFGDTTQQVHLFKEINALVSQLKLLNLKGIDLTLLTTELFKLTGISTELQASLTRKVYLCATDLPKEAAETVTQLGLYNDHKPEFSRGKEAEEQQAKANKFRWYAKYMVMLERPFLGKYGNVSMVTGCGPNLNPMSHLNIDNIVHFIQQTTDEKMVLEVQWDESNLIPSESDSGKTKLAVCLEAVYYNMMHAAKINENSFCLLPLLSSGYFSGATGHHREIVTAISLAAFNAAREKLSEKFPDVMAGNYKITSDSQSDLDAILELDPHARVAVGIAGADNSATGDSPKNAHVMDKGGRPTQQEGVWAQLVKGDRVELASCEWKDVSQVICAREPLVQRVQVVGEEQGFMMKPTRGAAQVAADPASSSMTPRLGG